MLRGLIVFLEIALLIILLRSEFMQYWLSDAQKTVSGWIQTLAEMPQQRELSDLEARIYPHVQGFSAAQHDYLQSILANQASLNQFHKLYCLKNDLNPFIYGASLRLICNEIKRSTLLYSHKQ